MSNAAAITAAIPRQQEYHGDSAVTRGVDRYSLLDIWDSCYRLGVTLYTTRAFRIKTVPLSAPLAPLVRFAWQCE